MTQTWWWDEPLPENLNSELQTVVVWKKLHYVREKLTDLDDF